MIPRAAAAVALVLVTGCGTGSDVTWIVHGVTRDGDSPRVVAEVEPRPDSVGYPRFLFVSECRSPADPALLGAYARQNDAWTLLFTADGAPPLPPARP